MSRGGIAWMLELREFVIAGAAATVAAKVAVGPWGSVIVRQIDTTVVPWVAISVKASGRLDGDERSFRDVARAVLEERATGRVRAILATVEERRD